MESVAVSAALLGEAARLDRQCLQARRRSLIDTASLDCQNLIRNYVVRELVCLNQPMRRGGGNNTRRWVEAGRRMRGPY